MKRIGLKLLIFNGALSLLNIILFAKPFFHIRIGASALSTAFGVMVVVMSVILFFYGNMKMLTKKPEPQIMMKDTEIKTLDDCTIAVNEYIENNIETFAKSLNTVLSQITRMKKKKASVHKTLLERFSETELSYGKFSGAVDGIENIMILNIRSLLIRINAFDEEDYEKLIEEHSNGGGQFIGQGDKITESKLSIYREYMTFVERAVVNNEEMLIRLDKLLLEISKLNSLSQEEIENMGAMKEIDSLINDTKWYR